MALIDRRIGLLFLAFLALLALALSRATYLGAVQGGLAPAGGGHPAGDAVTFPAARGTITDRNGVELAISESADDRRRPVPDQGPAERWRRSSRRCSASRVPTRARSC